MSYQEDKYRPPNSYRGTQYLLYSARSRSIAFLFRVIFDNSPASPGNLAGVRNLFITLRSEKKQLILVSMSSHDTTRHRLCELIINSIRTLAASEHARKEA